MDSSSSPTLAATVPYSTLASLRLGRTAQSIVVRLTRFWDSKNINKDGQFMGITLLLLDEQDTVIHGFVPANLANRYRSSLKAGSVVTLDRFEVARCPHMYKVTEHQYVIRFIPSTRISELGTEAPVIKSEKFIVRRYDHLQVLANSNLELPGRINLQGLLKAGDKTQSVILVTTVNPKLFGGNLYLNSTQGTRFFFDTTIPEIAEFVSSVGAMASEDFSCVDTLEGLKRKELVSIGDLNTFISNSNEQEADFLCKARIVSVISESGWSFVSCTACSKKLEQRGTSLYCNRCVTSDVTGVVRFRVELAVDDGRDSATFVVFDKEMTKLTKQEAADLALDEGSNGGEDELPSCLEQLAGKEFVFQIRVTPFNFTSNHRTFTVSRIARENTTTDHGKGQSVSLFPATGSDAGLTPASSGPSVLGDKSGEEGDGEDTLGVSKTQRKRKRSCE